jgi:hypothetical protein
VKRFDAQTAGLTAGLNRSQKKSRPARAARRKNPS